MALWPKPNVLLIDPAEGLSDANRWKESSGNGLDALPGAAYAAPAYGFAAGPSGAPYIVGGGVADSNATLPLGFYTRAPTTGMTVLLVQKFTAPAAGDFVFSCLNAAPNRGFVVDFPTSERLRIRGYDVVGAIMSATMTADGPLAGRTRVVVIALDQAGSAARAWIDGQQVAATFAGSVFALAYDAAVVPTLFSIVGGAGNYNDASVYLLGIDGRVWSHQEVVAFSSFWLDRI